MRAGASVVGITASIAGLSLALVSVAMIGFAVIDSPLWLVPGFACAVLAAGVARIIRWARVRVEPDVRQSSP